MVDPRRVQPLHQAIGDDDQPPTDIERRGPANVPPIDTRKLSRSATDIDVEDAKAVGLTFFCRTLPIGS